MPSLPDFLESGDLPVGIHQVSLEVAVQRLARGSARRVALGERLRRVYELAAGTKHLARFILFGSMVTADPMPNDVDVFLLMDDEFDASHLHDEARVLFDHPAAQAYFGASVFWLRRLAALGGEDAAIAHWQIKRDGSRRGIVEITGP